MIWIGIIAIIISLIFIKNSHNLRIKSPKIYGTILGLLLLGGGVILTYKLGKVPYGVHVDEAGMAYDAFSLSRYHVDRWLNYLPVYFINYGGGQSALYAYLAAIFVKLFGLSTFAVRLPSVIVSLISLYCFYKLVKEDDKKSILPLILLSVTIICPFHIMKSRWGLDCYLLFPLLIISLYTFLMAIKKEKKILFMLAGILFGITLYTYAISYIIVAMLVACICMYLLIIKKIKFINIIYMGIPLFLLALPLMLLLLNNSGILSLNLDFKFFSIPKLWFYRGGELSISNIFNNLNIFKTLLINDNLYYNVFPQFGSLYYISIPFLIMGFIIAVYKAIVTLKEKEINTNLILTLLFLITLICVLLISSPNINKANALFISMLYFVALGIYFCVKHSKISMIIICSCYLISFVTFSHYYFVKYPKEIQNSYQFVAKNDFDKALDVTQDFKDKIIYVNDGSSGQTYIYTLLYEKMSPYEFNQTVKIENYLVKSYKNYNFEIPEAIDTNAIYILYKEDKMISELQKNDFQIIDCNNFKVLYKR